MRPFLPSSTHDDGGGREAMVFATRPGIEPFGADDHISINQSVNKKIHKAPRLKLQFHVQ